jgi:hypothetical protein
MANKYIFTAFIALALILTNHKSAVAQCDSTASIASTYMGENFVSDGQSYRALIFDDQVAEFTTTLYGNSTYRIVGIAGLEREQIHFKLYDEEDNLLFSNEEYQNSPYWDFEINSTLDCRIEAKLDLMKQKSGCAVLLIGFEQ